MRKYIEIISIRSFILLFMIVGFGQISAQKDSTKKITHVTFYGYASPEGSYQLNKKLAFNRLINFENYFRSYIQLPDSIIIRSEDYIPWKILQQSVKASDITNKQKIIDIINQPEELVNYGINKNIDKRIVQLKQRNNGNTWWQLNKKFFAEMRKACAMVITLQKLPIAIEEVKEATSSITIPIIEEEPVIEEEIVINETKRPFYMAVKSNLIIGNKWNYGGGVEYGYSLPLAHRLNIDFTIGLGCTGGESMKFIPFDGHHLWQSTALVRSYQSRDLFRQR